MFEPVHGSAPDIAGKNIVNPLAAILCGAMMLDHLGETNASKAIESAVENVLVEGEIKTCDLGGNASTIELGDEIVKKIKQI